MSSDKFAYTSGNKLLMEEMGEACGHIWDDKGTKKCSLTNLGFEFWYRFILAEQESK